MLTVQDRKELEAAAKVYVPKRRTWSKKDLDDLLLFWSRVPDALIAKKLGRSINSCRCQFATITRK